MNADLIIALAKLSDKGLDVAKLVEFESNSKPTKQTKEEVKPDVDNLLATILKNATTHAEKPEEKPKEKPEEKPEEKNTNNDVVGLSTEQFNKLMQSLNTSKASIDLPDSNDWRKALEKHYNYMINGEKED